MEKRWKGSEEEREEEKRRRKEVRRNRAGEIEGKGEKERK